MQASSRIQTSQSPAVLEAGSLETVDSSAGTISTVTTRLNYRPRSFWDDRASPNPVETVIVFRTCEQQEPSPVTALSQSFESAWDRQQCQTIGRGTYGTIKTVPSSVQTISPLAFKINRKSDDYLDMVEEGKKQLHLRHEALMPCLGYAMAPSVECCLLLFPRARRNLWDRLYESDMSPFPWQNRLEMLAKIAEGTQYLHNSKIVHRDLYYTNILLDHLDHPFITDLGSALALHAPIPNTHGIGPEHTSYRFNGKWVLNPLTFEHLHLAPESYFGATAEPAEDIFVLGVLLTGLVEGTNCQVAWTNSAKCTFERCPPRCQHFRWPAAQGNQIFYAYPGRRGFTIDKTLANQTSVSRACELAAQCLNTDPSLRPDSASLVSTLTLDILRLDQTETLLATRPRKHVVSWERKRSSEAQLTRPPLDRDVDTPPH